MSEEQLREPQRGLTFEDVWAMFQETDRRFKETDRKIQETALQMKETDRQMKETDRKMKETDFKISSLGSRVGDLVEELFAPSILEKFNALGYVFGRVARDVRYRDPRGGPLAEVDILLENGDVAMAVEVKTNLTVNDVKDHVRRMETLRRYADDHGDKRKLLGAVAGALATDGAKTYAVKQGFFVMEQSGDAVRISVPEGFKPKEW
jgi:hypothetical protein